MRTPNRFRPSDPREAAEAAFKREPIPAGEPEAMGLPQPAAGLPVAKEMVSLRLDQDVLAHFQADGPGWQERINAALRQAAGK
jgi:uncharacterized protein (DUF4415 family)